MKSFQSKTLSVRERALPVILAVLCVVMVSCGDNNSQNAPEITVTPTRILHKGWVDVRGARFSPKASVDSHLRRPDGTEFPVLPMLTDDRGELTHEVDTLLLQPGVHDLWIVDSTGVSSNIAQFEVTLVSPESEK